MFVAALRTSVEVIIIIGMLAMGTIGGAPNIIDGSVDCLNFSENMLIRLYAGGRYLTDSAVLFDYEKTIALPSSKIDLYNSEQ